MSSYKSDTDKYLKELNSLIGLQPVKDSILEIVYLQIGNQKKKQAGMRVQEQTLHMLFTGNPGTGKTTVARLIGNIFKSLGILKKGTFKEVSRNDLVGQYVGHTADKTTKAVKSALDGVLFVDEAYALSRGGERDFGNEAIDTLVPLMENHRNCLIVILAGYSNEMEQFMLANSGLSSRITFKIEFPDYTPEELFRIFMSMCKDDDLILSKAVENRVYEALFKLHQNKGNNFGNGREVRNFLGKMIRQQSRRLARENICSKRELKTFIPEDVPDDSPVSGLTGSPLNIVHGVSDDFDISDNHQNVQDIHDIPPTSENPLLLGMLVDVSLSMIKSVFNRDDAVQNRFEGFRESLRKVVNKAREICQEKESGNVAPLLKVFAMGFGFGNPLSFILGDNFKLKVRDLFDFSESQSSTVPINTLIDDWEKYENHIEKLTRNMCGETPMGEAFRMIEKRIIHEYQSNTYHPNPVLFILSDGVPTDDPSQHIIKIAKRIKDRGVFIVSCYVTDKNIMKPKSLFSRVNPLWEEGARLMFECASTPPKDSTFYRYFNELGWDTNNNTGRLFAQVNESQFLEDFMESVISPLKDRW